MGGAMEQLFVSSGIYIFSYFSFLFCEWLIRHTFGRRRNPNDHDNAGYCTLGLFEVRSEHKRACLALLFLVIAGTGYFADYLGFDAMDCVHLGHGLYHIASAIALT